MTRSDRSKLVWITGAGKGIGRALAKRMAHENWTVAASARTLEDIEDLARECPEQSVYPYPLDVTDLEQTEITINDIEKTHGSIDLVVLNAGTHTPLSVDDFSAETFRHLMETNFMGSVNGLAHVLPKMTSRGKGHIAVVASLAGYRGLPTSSAYGASKAALINMCEALKPELDRKGIKLTLINPGFVETPLTDQNEFPMPFLIPVDVAVEHILKGLQQGRFEIAFPWRFAFLMKLLRILPDGLFFKITGRMIDE